MLGVAFSLLSALSFSMSGIFARRGVAGALASQGQLITVLGGLPMFVLAALLTGQLLRAAQLPLESYLLLAAAGLVNPGIGRYCHFRAMSHIGAARASPIEALQVPFSVIVAFLVLAESVNGPMMAGILLIILGPMAMWERRRRSVPAAAAPTPAASKDSSRFDFDQVQGYTFAGLAAVAYGTTPILIRAAFEDTSGMGIFGGMIAYSAASLLLMATMVKPSRRELVRTMDPKMVRLFASSTTFTFLAQMFRYVALSAAPVVVVQPLQRTAGLFTLVLSWLFNRSLERITLRVMLGVLISTAGSGLIILGQLDTWL